MGTVSHLAFLGLTNRESEDYGKWACGKNRTVYFCKSYQCCSYFVTTRKLNKQTRTYEKTSKQKMRPKAMKIVKGGNWRECPDCGKGLFLR